MFTSWKYTENARTIRLSSPVPIRSMRALSL
jgi:hypothetical protein